ncbi:MAG: DUF58 domain-containing protein [Leptolyngbyaceae bacterium]|nr:DUF58 domain-containing protein [Leptolyngbyaceae bacterium]
MTFLQSIFRWLEINWVVPAYPGWVLGGLVLFFFGAATNTMAGWLYVMSGGILALLAIAASLPPRILKGLSVERHTILPTMAGTAMAVHVTIHNTRSQARELLQLKDALPTSLTHLGNHSAQTVIDQLKPHGLFEWKYSMPAVPRGIYEWSTVQFRTAAPLGLFWCRRDSQAPARAIVYPTILALEQCPLMDELGHESRSQRFNQQNARQANEGLTRALRPYRWGDPTRLIHWRTSARYGELRVRELEVLSSHPSVVIAIDTAIDWHPESFEQAAIAAISLYDYARRQQMAASVWTAEFGMLNTQPSVYEALAAIAPHQGNPQATPKASSVIWLTQFPTRLDHVSSNSSWLLWTVPSSHSSLGAMSDSRGTQTISHQHLSDRAQRGQHINPDQDLKTQLSTSGLT